MADLVQSLHGTFGQLVSELVTRGATLSTALQAPLPQVPLPLDKSGVETNQLLTRLASVLGGHSGTAAGVLLKNAKIDVSAPEHLYSLGKQLALHLSTSSQIPELTKEILQKHVYAATGTWLTSVFSLWASKTVAFAANESEALSSVVRTALAFKYDAFTTDGFQSLYTRPPVFYVAENTAHSTVAALSMHRLIPSKLIRRVPLAASSTKIDVAALEKLIAKDIEEGLLPTLILTRAETPITGEIDDLLPIRVLCEKHRIWMHLQGAGLGVLALSTMPAGPLTAAVMADSVSLNPADWLPIPTSPWATFFRTPIPLEGMNAVHPPSPSQTRGSGSAPVSPLPITASLAGNDLALVLPLWLVLQSVGQNSIVASIAKSVDLVASIIKAVGESPAVAVTPRVFDGQYLLLKFQPPASPAPSASALLGVQSYPTVALGQHGAVVALATLATYKLHQAVNSPHVDLVQVGGESYIRLRPFHASAEGLDGAQLAGDIVRHATIIAATWKHQQLFERVASEHKLLLAPVFNFLGLGAVQYVPSFVDLRSLTDQTVADLNDLNVEIAKKLIEEEKDLFAIGSTLKGSNVCINVGLTKEPVTEEEVHTLIEVILTVASAAEKDSKLMRNLEATVKSNIESAQSAISQQIESELEDELLRQIPIVGSLYSMWYTESPKKNKVSGRYYSIKDGKLGKSEEIVKATGVETPTGTGSPPVVPAAALPATTTAAHAPLIPFDFATLKLEKDTAISAVTLASKVSAIVFNSLQSDDTITKEDKSPVTVADFAAQAVVHTVLRKVFPTDKIISEEDSHSLQDPSKQDLAQKILGLVNSALGATLSQQDLFVALDQGTKDDGDNSVGRVWTLDPIDGTKGFLRQGQFAVCLALMDNGVPVLSVMGCPNLPLSPAIINGERGVLFVAVKGHGSWQRALSKPVDDGAAWTRIFVHTVTDPANAILCESVEAAHSAHASVTQMATEIGIVRPSLRLDSQCKYALVARGEATLYVRLPTDAGYVEKIWDHVPGWLLVKEAGGQVTDAHGKPLNFVHGHTLKGNAGIIASNSIFHGRAQLAITSVLLGSI